MILIEISVIITIDMATIPTEQLFGSKTRVKLLSLFLNNPNRPFYVREITRKIDEQINSVRRELANLLSVGVIKSATEKNRLYYESNQKFIYYSELQSIFSAISSASPAIKETKEEEHITKMFRTCGSIELAILCGTFVRDSNLGVDMLIVGDVNRTSLAKTVAQLEEELKRELNYTVMTLDDYEYRLNLNDRFLANLMDAKKITLINNLASPVNQPINVEESVAEVLA